MNDQEKIKNLEEENKDLHKHIVYLSDKSPDLTDEKDFLMQACKHLPHRNVNSDEFKFYLKVINAYDEVFSKEREF